MFGLSTLNSKRTNYKLHKKLANQNRRHMSLRLCGTGKRCCALIRRRSIQKVWSVYDAGKKSPYFAQIETQREQYIIDLLS